MTVRKITEAMAEVATEQDVRLLTQGALGVALRMMQPCQEELQAGEHVSLYAAARATADFLAKSLGPKAAQLADQIADGVLQELIARSGLPSIEKH